MDNINKKSEIFFGQRGNISWIYEYNLWKEVAVFITILKVLLLSTLFPALVIFFVTLEEGFLKAIRVMAYVYFITGVSILCLLMVSYIIVAIINGGKYIVLFELDEFGVNHIQMPHQYKKNNVLSMIGVVFGAIANNYTAIGANLLSMSKKNMYTDFKKVKKIIINKKKKIIYLNETFKKNQIYILENDFDYIKEIILSKSKNATVLYK